MNILHKITLILSMTLFFLNSLVYAQPDHNQDQTNKILLIADNHLSKGKMELIQKLAASKQIQFEYEKSAKIKKDQATQKFKQYDLVLFDSLNPRIAKMMFAKYSSAIKNNPEVKFEPIRLPFDSKYRQGITNQQADDIKNYYHNGGSYNFEQLMAYISSEIFGNTQFKYKPFVALPNNGYYHYQLKNKVSNVKEELVSSIGLDSSKPVVAISMHRSAIEAEQTHIIDGIIKSVEAQGAFAFGFFFDGSSEDIADPKSASVYLKLLQDEQKQSWIDVIVNSRMIHYMSKRHTDYEQLKVPVIHTLSYYDGDQKSYEEAHTGISATMTPYFIVMPETAGVIDQTLITYKDPKSEELKFIDYQLEALAERAIRQGRLARKANKDKKIAIMVWNYPPGEKNIGAAFLNIPQSLEQITNDLIGVGYTAESKPEDYFINNAGGLLKPLYRTGYQDSIKAMGLNGYIPLKDYKEWFAKLPQNIQDEITDHWGQPDDHPLIEEIDGEPQFLVARIQNGNIITLPQPSNASNDDEHASIYHGGSGPSSHYYFAAYLYVKKTFGADAIVHLGTHGNQEWLFGKERALSIYDSPSLAVGNLPVIYPYLIDNVGEGLQAKRRGRATMISHMTPGFAAAGLHSNIKKMEELINQHDLLEEGDTKQKTRQSIVGLIEEMDLLTELKVELNLGDNIDLKNDQVFKQVAEYTHEYMHELSYEAQPLGLHTFGTHAKESHLITTIQQMISPESQTIAHKFEVEHKLAEKIKELKPEDNVITQEFSKKMENVDATQLTDILGFKLLWLTIVEGLEFDLPEKLTEEIEQGKDYFAKFKNHLETQSLVATLNAEFIGVAPGGDPIRSPQSLPSGRNMIGFNPAKVPSKESYETGKELAEETIQNYYNKHGKFPDKLAFSLWSLETIRHHGVLESQIMAALGVKPKWDHRGMVVGTEIIEYKDLKRPRVDVAISATGLYRDAFPNVMLLLAKAIDDIAELKEDNNSVYKNAQALKAKLLDNGATQEDAEYLSSVRIFSNDSGAYGTGLADASLASGTWETDKKLSDLYLDRMGYAFGPDEARWSERPDSNTVKSLYSEVLSGTDAVVFSRTSNLYGMLTSDDPFQYFGGISLAVRNIDGESPEMYIANLRNSDKTKTESIQKFMGRELRTRALHPRWVKEMQSEGYAGATTILDRVNNFWGWTVMDPNSVNNTQWQELVEVYVNDKYDLEMKEFFEKNNPHVLAQLIERFLEAERKDYFDTDEETLKKLTEVYLEMANKYDVYSDNEKFKERVEELAGGFGLDFDLPTKESVDFTQTVPDSAKQQERVEGQKLEKQESQQDDDINYEIYFVILGILVIFLAGFGMQMRRKD